MKPASLRHIRRMDDAVRRTHAWLVQVQRQNRMAVKMFSDSVWGGKRKSLAAAKAWRDEKIEPLAEYEHQLWRRNRVRRNNRSGLVGVARYERSGQNGSPHGGAAFWLASWVDEKGISRKRKFSVKRWGERRARQKAIEVREEQLRRAVAAKTTAAALSA